MPWLNTLPGMSSCGSKTPITTAAARTLLQKGRTTFDSTYVVPEYLFTHRHLFYSHTFFTTGFNIRIVSLQIDL